MFRYILLGCLMAPLAFAQIKAPVLAEHSPIESKFAKLEQHILNEIKKGAAVGAAVAIVERGEAPYIKAFGVRKKGEQAIVDTNTVFQLGSASKPITASLFALAQKQKLINLNTPVTIDKVTLPNIEARHLLSHASGFSRQGFNWQIEHGKSRIQMLDLLKEKPRLEPGKAFDYHNFVFSLIEYPLQKAFNMPFAEALTTNVLKPLGMTKTTIGFDQFMENSNRAWPHEIAKNGKPVPAAHYSRRYHETVQSAGGINTNGNDIIQFLKLQLGLLPNLLTSADLAPFHSPVISAPDSERWFKKRIKGDFSGHYGYGWRILKTGDEHLVFHGGWLKGFTSIVAISPKEGRGIAVLSNTENGFAFSTAMEYFGKI